MTGILASSRLEEYDPNQPRIKGGLGGGRWTKWLKQVEQQIHALGPSDHIELLGGVKITPASPIKHRGAVANDGSLVDRPATFNVTGGEGMDVRGATKERAAKAAAQRIAKSTAPGTPGGRQSIDFKDADEHSPPANTMQGVKVVRAPAKKFKGHGRVEMEGGSTITGKSASGDTVVVAQTRKVDLTKSSKATMRGREIKVGDVFDPPAHLPHAKPVTVTAVNPETGRIKTDDRRTWFRPESGTGLRKWHDRAGGGAADPPTKAQAASVKKNLREDSTMTGRGILAEAQGGTDRPGAPNPSGSDGQRGGRGAWQEDKHPRKKSGLGGGRFIKKGSSGQEVVAIQREIGAKPDGTFGAGTERKLTAWQAKQGIQADGVAGAQTVGRMRDQPDTAPGKLGAADRKFLHERGSDSGRRATDPDAGAAQRSGGTTGSSQGAALASQAAKDKKRKGKKNHGMREGFEIKGPNQVTEAVINLHRMEDPAEAQAHIIERAKDLKCEQLLPAAWRDAPARVVERRGRNNHVLR